MNNFTRVVCIIGMAMSFLSCGRKEDYSTETGRKLFPFQPVSMSRLTLTKVDPVKIKLKDADDIRVFAYAIRVDKKHVARGYLFEGPKDEREKSGNACVIPLGFHPWDVSSTGTSEDIPLVIRQVNDYRVGLDILFSRFVDKPSKAILIGHDYGAIFSILTAAADSRVGAAAIMAPVSRFYYWNRILRSIPEGPVLEAYKKAMLPYEPITLIRELTIPVLFQFGESDEFVSKGDALALIDAASASQKDARWYKASHSLTRYPRITEERTEWVKQHFFPNKQER